ncbi:MAG TPA: HAD family hydrolase [Lachnospiraceae bacterium]|nr:HAD family hydrolase [Lachnospiraceae bacterium]
MIRLIASDLDGTLLHNGSQEVSKEMIELIKKLISRGILFVAASGRQYPNLRRLFEPVQNDIAYICENGALVMYKEQVLSKSFIDRSIGLELLDDIRSKDGCEILLSGQATSYLQPKLDSFAYHMEHVVHNNVTVVQDILTVTEPFYKISICEFAGIADHTGPYFIDRWSDKLKATISGHAWLDFTHPDTNKGAALSSLLKKLSILPTEAMAFGDNYNDIEMLSNVTYGYAMDNANEDIKAICSYHTSSVEKTLADFVNQHTSI